MKIDSNYSAFWFVVLMVVGAVPLQAVDMTPPQTLSGFNGDVVVENGGLRAAYTSVAGRVNPGEVWVFYQSGLAGKSFGLPVSGIFCAVGDGHHVPNSAPHEQQCALAEQQRWHY